MPNKEIKTSHLLFDESPLIVRPELACRVGLNESIILQQVHYWLENKRKTVKEKDVENEYTYRDGRFWTYNTYDEWQEQFPFWSKRTIERTVKKLEDAKILLSSSDYNKLSMDRTKWYSIDYDVLDTLESKSYARDRKININKKETSKEENNENNENEEIKNKQEESEKELENSVENLSEDNVKNNTEIPNYPFPTDDDIPHYDNLTECVVMHNDNLTEWGNHDYDNLTECVVTHNDNLTECISSDCRDHNDNLSSPIPKNTLSKNSYTKNPLVNSSSSSELNKEEENKKIVILEFMLEQSEIMPNKKSISETINLVREKRLDFDVNDIALAINHYEQKSKETPIACPPIYFVNGFEMEINKRYYASRKEKDENDKNQSEINYVQPKVIPSVNWVD